MVEYEYKTVTKDYPEKGYKVIDVFRRPKGDVTAAWVYYTGRTEYYRKTKTVEIPQTEVIKPSGKPPEQFPKPKKAVMTPISEKQKPKIKGKVEAFPFESKKKPRYEFWRFEPAPERKLKEEKEIAEFEARTYEYIHKARIGKIETPIEAVSGLVMVGGLQAIRTGEAILYAPQSAYQLVTKPKETITETLSYYRRYPEFFALDVVTWWGISKVGSKVIGKLKKPKTQELVGMKVEKLKIKPTIRKMKGHIIKEPSKMKPVIEAISKEEITRVLKKGKVTYETPEYIIKTLGETKALISKKPMGLPKVKLSELVDVARYDVAYSGRFEGMDITLLRTVKFPVKVGEKPSPIKVVKGKPSGKPLIFEKLKKPRTKQIQRATVKIKTTSTETTTPIAGLPSFYPSTKQQMLVEEIEYTYPIERVGIDITPRKVIMTPIVTPTITTITKPKEMLVTRTIPIVEKPRAKTKVTQELKLTPRVEISTIPIVETTPKMKLAQILKPAVTSKLAEFVSPRPSILKGTFKPFVFLPPKELVGKDLLKKKRKYKPKQSRKYRPSLVGVISKKKIKKKPKKLLTGIEIRYPLRG